jgi:PTS system nitrogen regulatory IIA component
MQLEDYLDKDLILPDLRSDSKPKVLEELLYPLQEKWKEFDLDKARDILLEREKLGSTGIGNGVAIPHGKMDELENIVLVVGRSLKGLDFEALDRELCTIFFLVLAPEDVAGTHLRLLAHISRLLKDPDFRGSFMEAHDGDGLYYLLKNA